MEARGAHNSEDVGSKPTSGIPFCLFMRAGRARARSATRFPVSHSFPVIIECILCDTLIVSPATGGAVASLAVRLVREFSRFLLARLFDYL